MLTFGSLFAGIGGFDLGLERAGMTCAWQVEREPYAVRVLEKHWPNVRRHDDVCTFPPAEGDWSVDLICGGFPCQDISVAGKGLGLAGARSGLWQQMHRIIGEIRPRFVLVENVAALLGRGMATVLGDLSSIGYDAEWHIIPASAVGAPHRRERVWIVAHADCAGTVSIARTAEGCGRTDAGFRLPPLRQTHRKACSDRAVAASGVASNVPHTNCGCMHRLSTDARDGGAIQEQGAEREFCGGNGCKDVADAAHSDDSQGGCQGWRTPLQSRGGCGRSGTGDDWWAAEPDVGRVAYGVPSRVDRLRGLGNAVVPQIVELIGRRIIEHAARQEAG